MIQFYAPNFENLLQVPVPYPVEKIVPRIVERTVTIPGPTQVVEKIVEVPKYIEIPIPVDRVREVPV